MSIVELFFNLFKSKPKEQRQTNSVVVGTVGEGVGTYGASVIFMDKEHTEDDKYVLYGIITHGNEEFLTIGHRFALEVDKDEFEDVELNRQYPVGVQKNQVKHIRWSLVN